MAFKTVFFLFFFHMHTHVTVTIYNPYLFIYFISSGRLIIHCYYIYLHPHYHERCSTSVLFHCCFFFPSIIDLDTSARTIPDLVSLHIVTVPLDVPF